MMCMEASGLEEVFGPTVFKALQLLSQQQWELNAERIAMMLQVRQVRLLAQQSPPTVPFARER
jgi:hypothetical protein